MNDAKRQITKSIKLTEMKFSSNFFLLFLKEYLFEKFGLDFHTDFKTTFEIIQTDE